MCSILLMAIDCNNATDPWKHARKHKKWDVITVKPDDVIWGTEDLTYYAFRILDLPNVSVAYAESFLTRETPETAEEQFNPMRKRKFYPDLDSAVGQLKNYLQDDTRADARFTHNITEAQLEQLKTARLKVPPS